MLNLNEKHAELVGHLLGDGHVHRESNYAEWSNSNEMLVKTFNSLLNEMQIKFKIDFRPAGVHKPIKDLPIFSGPSIRVRFKLPEELIRFVLRGKKKHQKYEIPKWIKNNTKAICGFIRGFFDDEGSVDLNGRSIRFHNTNKSILGCIKELTNSLDIKSGKICKESSCFVLHISGYYNILKFSELIGTNHMEKLEKLNVLLQRYKPTNIKILEILAKGPKTPRQLAKILGKSDSDICILLKKLIEKEKVFLWNIEGRNKFYFIKQPTTKPLSTKEKIINLIKNESKTAKELSQKLHRDPSSILKILRKLQKGGRANKYKIKRSHGQEFKWSLSEKRC